MTIEKQLFRSGPYKDLFSQGVRVGDALYLAGQVGVDADGKAGVDITEQTRLAYQNIAAVLAEFGATMDNVVDETMFVTDVPDTMANAAGVFSEREKAYGKKPEVCQTLIGVSALVLAEYKVEIKCIAHL